MNIYELTDSALGRVFNNFYHGLPDFSSGEPKVFATYVIQEEPALSTSDSIYSYEYNATVMVFTPNIDIALYKRVKSEFKSSGFSYSKGNDTLSDGYPQKKIYTMEFKIDIDTED